MNEKSKGEKISLLAAAVLTILGFCNAVLSFITGKITVIDVVSVVLYILLILYATVLYKKPHGNLMKFLILIFAFVCGITQVVAPSINAVLAVINIAAAVTLAFMAGRLDRLKQNSIIALVVLVVLVGVSVTGMITMQANTDAIVMPDVMDTEFKPEVVDGEAPAAPPEGETPGEKPEDAPEGETPAEAPSTVSPVILSINTAVRFFDLPILWLAIFFGYRARFREHKEVGTAE